MDISNIWSGIDLSKQKQNTRCLAVNTILAGKYLVGPVLGQGGFGITYMGFDLNMETKIAIKEYFPVELVSRDTTTMHGDRVLSLGGEKSTIYQAGLKKYVAEAQNVSQFSEIPGVVSVKDFFYENETAYIVMEFIDGISLKDYLKEKGGRLSEKETLRIMKPVLEALVKVHGAGMIHRDISPDNIMMTFESDGNSDSGNGTPGHSAAKTSGSHKNIKDVKLIDFGAARMTEKNDQKSLTIILKHGYAPEEQYRTHGEQGPWTDVYAVCAVLYRMLTGETPVPAMDRLFQDELKTFEQQNVVISKHVSAAILKGLAIKKEDRIRSIQQLIGVLYHGNAVQEKSKGSAKRKNQKLFAAIGCAAVLAVVGITLFGGNGKKDELSSGMNISESIETTVESEPVAVETESKNTEINSAGNQNMSQNSSGGSVEMVMEEEGSNPLGEIIVEAIAQTSIATDEGGHVLFVMPDGTVQARGSNLFGQCMVQDWDHVVAVAADSSNSLSLGLRADGTVYAAGPVSDDNYNVESWTDVIGIAIGLDVCFGLRRDGTVLISGFTSMYDVYPYLKEVAEWKNIKAICTDEEYIFGLTHDGTIVVSGLRMEQLQMAEITDWNDVTTIYAGDFSTGHVLVGLCDDGALKWTEVRYDESDGMPSSETPERWNGTRQMSGEWYGLAVKEDGTILTEMSCPEELKQELSQWTDMLAVTSVGNTHIFGLKKDGTILEYLGKYGNSDLDEMTNLAWIEAVGITVDTLVAGTKDGRILTYGSDEWYITKLESQEDVIETDIAGTVGLSSAVRTSDGMLYGEYGQVVASDVVQAVEVYTNTNEFAMLKKDGTIDFAKAIYDGYIEDQEPEGDERAVYEAENWKNVVQIVSSNFVTEGLVGLHEDGTVSSAGMERMELSESVLKSRRYKKLAIERFMLLGLCEDGTMAVLQSQTFDDDMGRTQVRGWKDIIDFAIGESHVVGLRADGTVVAAGSNHSKQCDVEEWTDIVYITVGDNCTLGITSDGTLKMAGSLY